MLPRGACLTLVVCACTAVASAVTYTGSLSVADGGLVASGTWNNPGTSISWVVDNETAVNEGFWRYEYTINVSDQGSISHLIIELSGGLTEEDLVNYFTDPDGWVKADQVQLQTTGGNNPLMPGDVFGVKLDAKVETLMLVLAFEVDRAPVPGDVYAKDGRPNGGEWATFYNAGFLDPDPDVPPWTVLTDHILRPDTVGSYDPPPVDDPPPVGGPPAVPEPVCATVLSLLAGGGLLARRFGRSVRA